MKILLLNLWGVIDGKGGTEKVFFDMAAALADRNYDVTALILENKTTPPFFNVSNKISFINCGEGFEPRFSLFQKLWIKLSFNKNKRHSFRDRIIDEQKAQRLEPVIVKVQPDIILSINPDATRALKLHMNMQCPVITLLHLCPQQFFSFMTDDTKKALEKSECIQVLMPSFIHEVSKNIRCNNIVSISNGVPQYELAKNIKRENIILHVGRFDHLCKRQHIIIEAFALLVNDFPDWKVDFWGEKDSDIKYYNYCQRLIKKHKLEGKVVFRGTTKNVEDVLKSAKIFAFPSAFEGFSLALTEAMSTGLPSVGCKDGISVNEIIVNGENGFLTDPNANDYADKLRILMENDILREKMGICAKHSIVRYAPNNIWDEWEKLIMNIICSKKNI